MAGFYDIFSTQIRNKPIEVTSGLEHYEKIFLDNYIDELYNLNDLKFNINFNSGTEADDDPFGDIVPDAQEVSIEPEPSNDPMSMDNNNLGANSPFDGLVDESGEMGDMFGNPEDVEQTPDQQAQNDQITVDREKLLRAAYNLGDNIRKIFPNRFLELREVIQSNLNSMELLELPQAENQDALRKLILLSEEQIKNIDIFLDIIAEQTFDSIFRKYVEIFTNCRKLKDAYELLIEDEEDKKNNTKKKKKSKPQQ